MQQIVKNAAETEQQQVFMVLCHLAATQPQLRKLPKTVAKVCFQGQCRPACFMQAQAVSQPQSQEVAEEMLNVCLGLLGT